MHDQDIATFSLLSSSVNTAELFPMLTLCSCISDAAESANGPRYCAKDKYTKCMYELRCLPLTPVEGESCVPLLSEGAAIAEKAKKTSTDLFVAQQERLEALVAASRRSDLPLSIALPIDAYVRELPSTGERFVVSVSPFTGLSLGDVIRSGWRLIEETDFEDILSCVEEYGSVCMQLPPHNNLSFSAILRQLNVRTGAAETTHRSRWVIGDWLLTPHSGAPRSSEEVLSDLEWLLHSTFSKLNVLCEVDGAVLREDVLEARINDTIERIRLGLATGVWCRSRVLVVNSQIYDSSLCGSPPTAKAEPSAGKGGAPVLLVDLVSKHQQNLRTEQQIIHNSRKQHRTVVGSGPRSNSSSKSVDGLNASVSSARKVNESDFDDTEKPMSFPDFGNSIKVSKALSTISPASGEEWQSFEMREKKLTILSKLTEMVEVASHRDAESRQNESAARKMHRDALYSMLLRSSLGLARRWRSFYGDRTSPPGAPSAMSDGNSIIVPRVAEGLLPKVKCPTPDSTSLVKIVGPVVGNPSPRAGQTASRFLSPAYSKDVFSPRKQMPHAASRVHNGIKNVSPNKPRQRGQQQGSATANNVIVHSSKNVSKRVEVTTVQSARYLAAGTSAKESSPRFRFAKHAATPRTAPGCKHSAVNLKKAASGRRTIVPAQAQTARIMKISPVTEKAATSTFERTSGELPPRFGDPIRTRSCGTTARGRIS